jgi:hypothetical protein
VAKSWAVWAFALAAAGCSGPDARRDSPASSGGCAACPAPASAAPAAAAPRAPASEIVLEAEEFKLTNVKVKDVKGASRGKAILLMTEDGKAETTVRIAKGTYRVEVYMQGQDGSSDAVQVSVAGIEMRFFDGDYGKIRLGATNGDDEVEIKKDGDYPVVISWAEPDVLVDRVVLKRKP